MVIQILLVLFALYALARSVGHYRRRAIGLGNFAVWVSFWTAVGVVVLVPELTQRFAGVMGVGRGADATLYVAVVGLSYGYFRLYLKSLDQDRQITKLVRRLALDEAEREPENQGMMGRWSS